MFKTGIYKWQLNAIVILLALIVFGQVFMFGTSPTSNANSTESVSTVRLADEGGISFDVNGKTVIMPKEMRGREKLNGFYEDGVMRIYVDDRPETDYQLKLSDDFIEIYDGNRFIGKLTYRTSLGRLVIGDNE